MKYDEVCRNYVWDVLSQRSLLAAWREDPRSKATKLMRVSFVMGDPQVTMGFNTKSWSFMTWMIWGTPILGNLHMNPHDITWYSMAFNVMILASLLCKKDCGTGGPSLDSLKFGTILWLTLVRLEAIDLASCANGDHEGGLRIFVRPRNGQIEPHVVAMLIVNTCKN